MASVFYVTLFFSHLSPGFQGQFCTKFYEKTCIDSLSGTALPGQSIYWRKVDCSVNNGRGDGDPDNCNQIKPTPPFVPKGLHLYLRNNISLSHL